MTVTNVQSGPIAKPSYGLPCNGCGLCCQNEICPLGQFAFPSWQAPCPALERDGDRFVCGLVNRPEVYAPIKTAVNGVEEMRAAAMHANGVGIGCDARLDEERDVVPPVEYTLAILRLARQPRSVSRKIEKLWSDAR